MVTGLQLQRYELFKTQNPEIGRFDITFEIEGKLLYAHRSMLTLISDTFDTMLSERWTSKEDAIKIEGNTFADFEQFIHFCYSEECKLSPENICALIDMAEFYNVNLFKSYCDEYASKMECTLDNIFSLLETAVKYSMPLLKETSFKFVAASFTDIINDIKCLLLNQTVFEELFEYCKTKVQQTKSEDFFRFVYNWSERQAVKKQEESRYSFSSLNEAIKHEISPFLPDIQFKNMNMKFLLDYVVKKAFIFSAIQLSEILLANYETVKIKVTNSKNETLIGNLPHDDQAVQIIRNSGLSKYIIQKRLCYWPTSLKSSPVMQNQKKDDKNSWNLIYFNDGDIGIKHSSEWDDLKIICQMIPDNNFSATENCKIEICH